jgi:hypothetical protein
VPACGDIWHTPVRSRTLVIAISIKRFSLGSLGGLAPALRGGAMLIGGLAPALRGGAMLMLVLFTAGMPLHARAQQEDALQTPPSGPPPGAQVAPPDAPVAAPVAPPEEEEQPPSEPSGEEASPPPTAVAPPLAEPEAATAATASASPPAEVEEDDESSLPWMASLSWSHAYNTAGLSRSAYQTFNPQYAWSFNAMLGYRFDDRTSIALSQGLAIELTDSDTTNTRQEPWLLDTAIDGERELIEHELDADHTLGATGSLGILLPTSKPSRAATMLFAGRAKLGGEYTADDVVHGLSAGVSFSYTHRFLRSNVLETESSYACVEGDLQDTTRSCSHLGSLTNTRDLFVLGVEGSLGLTEELTLGAQVSFGWNLGGSLNDQELAIDGSRDGVVRVGDDSLTHWRNSRVIGLSLEYEFTDWFTGATLFTNSFAERSVVDGQYRGPFNAQDMVLGLELTVSFDELYEVTRGHAASD